MCESGPHNGDVGDSTQVPVAREVSETSRWDRAVKGGREKQEREDASATRRRSRRQSKVLR